MWSVNCPNLSFELARASKIQDPTTSDILFLNRSIMQIKREPSIMRFVRIDAQTGRIVNMIAAAFATNLDHKSQLGIIIAVADN